MRDCCLVTGGGGAVVMVRADRARDFPKAPGDIEAVELYDAFTINTILFLEDLGFCAKGEGGAFVEGGHIAPEGVLPVNTNGRGLSCVHPLWCEFAKTE